MICFGVMSCSLIIIQLFPAPAFGFVKGPLHGTGDLVCIHDHFSIQVPGCPSRCLGQGPFRPEESLLVRIQDGHQRNFRKVQSLPEQVDTHQHIKYPFAQSLQDLHPFQGINIRVDVAGTDIELDQVTG